MKETNLQHKWLLITVSTAGGSASLRVYVWRRLRLLGAVYLQQSVCVLPANQYTQREINRFADRIKQGGGTVRVVGFMATDDDERQHLVKEFNDARDIEYGEVLERVPSFLEELEMERKRGRTTYAEVEESEADLDRFRAWLAKIAKRDYFAAPRGEDARRAVEHCAEELAKFEVAALASDSPMMTIKDAHRVPEILAALQNPEFDEPEAPKTKKGRR